MLGRSGSLMSLIFCGMFISLTAETARAGAADIPACNRGFSTLWTFSGSGSLEIQFLIANYL